MQSPHVRCTSQDGILTVTLARPEKLNAVTPPMLDALRAALDELYERSDLRVMVITGEGRFFTAGIDMSTMDGVDESAQSGIEFRRGYRRLHDFFDRIEASEKPVVLAAQGNCLGMGVEMSSSCDFRLAADTAQFGLPEVENLGMIPGSGGISRLARLIGQHWTAWLALAGETISAQDARMMGYVHAVYPAAEFEQRARAFALKLAALPAETVGVGKLALRSALSADRASARDFDRLANTLLAMSPAHLERRRAFEERAAARKAKSPGQ